MSNENDDQWNVVWMTHSQALGSLGFDVAVDMVLDGVTTTRVCPVYTKSIAFAINKFLEGEQLQTSQGEFAKKRYKTITKCLKSLLEKSPHLRES